MNVITFATPGSILDTKVPDVQHRAVRIRKQTWHCEQPWMTPRIEDRLRQHSNHHASVQFELGVAIQFLACVRQAHFVLVIKLGQLAGEGEDERSESTDVFDHHGGELWGQLVQRHLGI